MCRVYVGEIISEGSELEFLQMKPAPYNVVLEDGTYKGVLKLGLKFISSVCTRRIDEYTRFIFQPHPCDVILHVNSSIATNKCR
jgi:hypothetical protein